MQQAEEEVINAEVALAAFRTSVEVRGVGYKGVNEGSHNIVEVALAVLT